MSVRAARAVQEVMARVREGVLHGGHFARGVQAAHHGVQSGRMPSEHFGLGHLQTKLGPVQLKKYKTSEVKRTQGEQQESMISSIFK